MVFHCNLANIWQQQFEVGLPEGDLACGLGSVGESRMSRFCDTIHNFFFKKCFQKRYLKSAALLSKLWWMQNSVSNFGPAMRMCTSRSLQRYPISDICQFQVAFSFCVFRLVMAYPNPQKREARSWLKTCLQVVGPTTCKTRSEKWGLQFSLFLPVRVHYYPTILLKPSELSQPHGKVKSFANWV